MANTNVTKPEIKKLIKEYLNEANLMQLATVSNGKPWICSMWFVVDEDLNLYFFSSITTRHSQEISKDSSVAVAICLPHIPTENKVRSIQLEGTAELLTDPNDIETAIGHCVERIFTLEQIKQFMSHPNEPHRFYRIKPTKIILTDTVNLPDSPRQEYVPATTK